MALLKNTAEKTEREAGKKHGGGLKFFFMTLLLGAALAAAGFLYLRGQEGSTVSITTDMISERLEYVGDLVSLEYYYKDAASIDKDELVLAGVSIPFTSNRAIVTYEGVVKYGVPVKDIQISVNENRVSIRLPASRIISHEMPEEKVVVFDPGDNLFNPVTIDDFVSFKTERKAAIITEAEERGLPGEAQKKAGEILYSILKAIPGMENYEIVITYAPQ